MSVNYHRNVHNDEKLHWLLLYASGTKIELPTEVEWQRKVRNDQTLHQLSASADREVNKLKHACR